MREKENNACKLVVGIYIKAILFKYTETPDICLSSTTNLCIRSGTTVSHADICRAKSASAMASWGGGGG